MLLLMTTPRPGRVANGDVIAALIAYDIARRAMIERFEGKRVDDSGSGRL